MQLQQKIIPCLWFDDQAKAAAEYYVGIFPSSRITHISRYPDAGQEIHGKPPGSVLTVSFELDGCPFTALNGGPHFRFNEAISLQVICQDQAEVDHYWSALAAGGDPAAQQCGWLKDRFGLSWQVFPDELTHMLDDPDPDKANRVMEVMLQQKKIQLDALQRAYAG
ncbi:VOC family protein [Marinospirillum alkaliphilum]|uniref:Glyoxalase superfamily enzyme, possibly 3-demethylubiquinone-9 3-methyltransferase n=1 Tax=Marinospirillum alkaliphilum DSM 21637 TaxID=1122209 RepID=A0A1K1TJF8_9GAMM|nr:VOC family protein [Marinospirillum alkaliphilum]SFX00871.1 Glyoxalase superfamily enzyme, possibly 3-demethylubiquinone-9 3-methyltransferase [Marinospirillum alkaliphilum DSM 21637]